MAVSFAQLPQHATVDSMLNEALNLHILKSSGDMGFENSDYLLLKKLSALQEPRDVRPRISLSVRTPLAYTEGNSVPSMTPVKRNSIKHRKRAVQFATTEVTGVSRPPTSTEHWTLYYFEAHTITCKICKAANKTLATTKASEKMCEEGVELAEDVTELELSVLDDGNVYAPDDCDPCMTLTKIKSKELNVRVEIPHNYRYSRKLIRCKSEKKRETKS